MSHRRVWSSVAVAAVVLAAVAGAGYYVLEVPLSVTIEPKIYDPNANIGVLNEQAAFMIHVSNNLPSVVNMTVNISAGNSVVQSQKMIVEPSETRDLRVSQQLTTTGIWIVAATANETTPIRSYSFEVKTNSEEANVAINQWHDMQRNWYLALVNVIIAGFALALSIFSIGRRPKLSDEEIVELKHRIAKELQATQAGRDIMIGMSDDMVKALEEERERRKLRSPAETATALLGEYFKKRSPRKDEHRQHESQ